MDDFAFLEQVLAQRLDRFQDGQDPVGPGIRPSRLQEKLLDPQVAGIIGKARQILREVPDVRVDRVAAMRKALAGGSHPIDAKAVADRMLQESLLDELL